MQLHGDQKVGFRLKHTGEVHDLPFSVLRFKLLTFLVNLCVRHPEHHGKNPRIRMNGKGDILDASIDDKAGDVIKIVPGGTDRSREAFEDKKTCFDRLEELRRSMERKAAVLEEVDGDDEEDYCNTVLNWTTQYARAFRYCIELGEGASSARDWRF